MCIAYSNGPTCYSMLDLSAMLARVGMSITSDQWGPIPLVLFAGDVYTPNTPTGDPSLGRFQLLIAGSESTLTIGLG